MIPDLKQAVLLEIKSKTDDAEKGIKRISKTTVDEFGKIRKTVIETNKATGESIKRITEENEKWGESLSDFAKKHSNALMAVGAATAAVALAAKALKGAFELALGAAKKTGDEASKSFMAAYDRMNSAVDNFKTALGQRLMPALELVADALAAIVDTITHIVDSDYFRRVSMARRGEMLDAAIGKAEQGNINFGMRRVGEANAALYTQAALNTINGRRQGRGGGGEGPLVGSEGAGAAAGIYANYQRLGAQQAAALEAQQNLTTNQTLARNRNEAQRYAAKYATQGDEMVKAVAQAEQLLKLRDQAFQERQSFLEGIFGPVGKISGYQIAFEGLSGAATEAMDAWITGSKSMKDALHDYVGEALRTLAKQMQVEALKEAGYALASIAALDFRGAASHGAAAAGFEAAAIAAGYGARKMAPHGGWSGIPAEKIGSGAVTAGTRSYGPAGGIGGTNITIIAGDSIMDESPAARRARFARAVDVAQKIANGARTQTVEFR